MKSKSMASVNFENQCVSDAIGERVEISRLWGRWEEEPNHVTLTSPPAVAFSMDAVGYAQCIASVPDGIQITTRTQL